MKTNTNNSLRRVVVAAALVAGFVTAAHATEMPRVHVRYSDININNEAGAAALYQRIRNAAEELRNVRRA